MTWDECIRDGWAKASFRDVQRAKSLIGVSSRREKFVKRSVVDDVSAISLFCDMYESLLGLCQAMAFMEGFNILNHVCVTSFLEKQGLPDIARDFDRFRKLRNGLNYYGRLLDANFVRKTLGEMRSSESRLRKLMAERYATLRDVLAD
ncbi:MAG: hypothetical protein FJY76_02750 [Candidatus Aenigmarchaeota archaeon]|nr:hypothetical protein [Candidatus Aenigmarchaeota archaeon]